ncbi:radical SAM protein [bacterium]|nr:radical SAM protein [Nanoarchaeota archaeon]MBU1627329.1 radical SAM protein [bacterium]
MSRTIDFGKIEPTKFVFNNRIMFYNRITAKKLFLESEVADTDPTEWKKLVEGKVTIEEPRTKKFRLEVTLKCNSACDYCLVYKNEIPQIGQGMSLEAARRIIKRFNEEVKDGSLMVIGGEPLVNLDVVRYIVENTNGRIGVYTNATLVTEDVAKFLSRPNVTFYVSIDGMGPWNFHRKYLSGKPTFKDTMEGYKKLRDAGANTAITCLVTEDNIDHMTDLVAILHEEHEERKFGLSIPHFIRDSPFAVDIEKYTQRMLILFDYAKSHGVYIDQIAKRLDVLVNEKFRLYGCKIFGEQITFYPDGTETLCTKIDTIEDLRNAKVEDLLEFLPLNDESCFECAPISICGGGCFWDAQYDKSGRDQRECYFNNKLLRKMLYDMAQHAPRGTTDNKNILIDAYGTMLR